MFLEILRLHNVRRCEESFHKLTAWSEMQWGCAIAGEVGELCNLLKKHGRGDFQRVPGRIREGAYKEMVKSEIADVIIYLDLLAATLDIDLEEAIREKFNEVSDRVGSKIKLGIH